MSPDKSALVYSTYLGGAADDFVLSLALDGPGSAQLAGTTGSTDFPTVGALQAGFGGGASDAFLAKLAPTGDSLVYSTYLGAKGGSGVAVDADENACVTGGTFSNLLPTMNAYQPRNGGRFSGRGRDDVFLVTISDAPAPPPAIEEDDGRVSWTGTWAVEEAPGHSGGRAVYSDEAGASATITFTGTGISSSAGARTRRATRPSRPAPRSGDRWTRTRHQSKASP